MKIDEIGLESVLNTRFGTASKVPNETESGYGDGGGAGVGLLKPRQNRSIPFDRGDFFSGFTISLHTEEESRYCST